MTVAIILLANMEVEGTLISEPIHHLNESISSDNLLLINVRGFNEKLRYVIDIFSNISMWFTRSNIFNKQHLIYLHSISVILMRDF